MLWTVFEESSEDGDDHYDRPPPGDLESYYDLASQQSHTQEMVELTSSGSQDVNSKKEATEKQVVEAMVVPAEDEFEEEEDHQQEDIEANSQQQSSNFPDGGSRAWLVVLGTFFSAFASYGYVSTWGLGLSNILRANTTSRTFSFYYSLDRFFTVRINPASGTFPGTFVRTWDNQSTIARGEYFNDSVGLGIGCGMVFMPAMGIIGQWFSKKQGLEMGLTALGSSIGGTVFPIAFQKLIPRVGFSWTMRILGFIMLLALIIPNITLTRRLPLRNVSGGLFNFKAFKNPPFLTYAIAAFTGFLGLYTVPTYIELSALAVGVSPNITIYLVAIANAGAGLGSFFAVIMMDRIGALNFLAPTTLIAGVLSFLWPFSRTDASSIVIAALYGFMCGSFVSGLSVHVDKLGELSDSGRYTGMIMTVGAAGALCGMPISGAINQLTEDFKIVGYYAGSTTVVSVGFMVLTRLLVLKKLWGKF
ncbi:MFS general substrate transporter [Lentinula edodes]|uniref:MFS general substrate transporter n=1 Tax=Lentinula edodes TaxID=5353 RepID=A0A1Q3EBF4_LENED|nr:MFS general substrate transporter [Lentinula edodes]